MLHLIKKTYIEWIVVIIYTILNLKMLEPFLFSENSSGLIMGMGLKEGTGQNLMALFLGLFLNAALIIYVLNKNDIKS